MSEDPVDQSITLRARDYFARLLAARLRCDDPKTAGSQAQKDWIANIPLRDGTSIQLEPRTGVDAAGGGQSRFEVLFTQGIDVYVEVQATEYHTGHKPVQAQGRLLGFAHASSGSGIPARYYKVIGQPRKIHRWSRGPGQDALWHADYNP